MTFFNRLLIVAAVLLALHLWLREEVVERPPGVLAPEAPRQLELDGAAPVTHGEYDLRPLARFELKARVLGREDYRFDRGADLVPVDLALGWGPMSDSAVLEHIDISQSGRFYFWRVSEFPIPREAIERHSANMHLIPANASVERALDRVAEGDVVSLRGQLVEASSTDGFTWRSSLSRDDTGQGACELIWVESLAIEPRD